MALQPTQLNRLRWSEHSDYQIAATIGPNVGVTGKASQHRVTMSEKQFWSLDIDNGENTAFMTISTNGELLVVASP